MSHSDVIQESNPTKTSTRRDMLIIEGGSMTRSRAKWINQVIWILVQSTMDDNVIYARKEASFMLGSKSKIIWINTIQAAEDGAVLGNHATAQP